MSPTHLQVDCSAARCRTEVWPLCTINKTWCQVCWCFSSSSSRVNLSPHGDSLATKYTKGPVWKINLIRSYTFSLTFYMKLPYKKMIVAGLFYLWGSMNVKWKNMEGCKHLISMKMIFLLFTSVFTSPTGLSRVLKPLPCCAQCCRLGYLKFIIEHATFPN